MRFSAQSFTRPMRFSDITAESDAFSHDTKQTAKSQLDRRKPVRQKHEIVLNLKRKVMTDAMGKLPYVLLCRFSFAFQTLREKVCSRYKSYTLSLTTINGNFFLLQTLRLRVERFVCFPEMSRARLTFHLVRLLFTKRGINIVSQKST